LKISTLGDSIEDATTFRESINPTLGALLKDHHNTQKDIGEANTIFRDIQARIIRADLQQWLKAPEETIKSNFAAAKKYMSTGL
jgi:hypothetical protein